MTTVDLKLGDSRDVLKTLAADSIDAVVTDPPYALVSISQRFGKEGAAPAQFGADGAYRRASAGFMGRSWDTGAVAFDPEFWSEVLRVLKPGSHLLAFGSTRTYHRLVCSIEDAGFEIRDTIAWHYGQGFPKSHNLHGNWEGWGTALKPATELICLARKPLSEKSVAANVERWGTAALNIDACRIEGDSTKRASCAQQWSRGGLRMDNGRGSTIRSATGSDNGRWPANAIFDEISAVELDMQSGETRSAGGPSFHAARPRSVAFGEETAKVTFGHEDKGGASRFFYVPKPDRAERDAGLSGLTPVIDLDGRQTAIDNAYQRGETERRNTHPTVKPHDLLKYLCRLITPPGGIVLDPFCGSASTGMAAVNSGFGFLGIEMEPEYYEIARCRLLHSKGETGLFAPEALASVERAGAGGERTENETL